MSDCLRRRLTVRVLVWLLRWWAVYGPGVSFINEAYAQNGPEHGVRHFLRKGCDL